MRHLTVRLASILILILALGFAQAASAAEVWSFAHFVETEQSQTAKSFDSVLYLVNKGGSQVHHCWVDLRDENNLRLKINGTEVCPATAPPLCTITVNGFAKFKIQDWIAYAAAYQPWTTPTRLGYINLSCTQPLAGLNATLYVTNYHEDAFTASFAVDYGKILP